MITESLATLSIQSESESAAALTRILGIEPHDSHEIGDLTWSGRHPGRSAAPTHRDFSSWSYTVEREQTPSDDETGLWSVRELIRVFGPLAETLQSLRPKYDYRIWWSGFSDSWQGGFVIEKDLLSGLARLDADIFGTAYFDADDDDSSNGSA
jgi:hypothetical protein